MASSSSVTGMSQWLRALHQTELAVQKQAKGAVQAGLDANVSVSRVLSPVRTGYLKSRNEIRWVEKGPTRFVGEYYNDAPYAVFVALGTSRMRARDFVTPGFYAGRKKMLERGGIF